MYTVFILMGIFFIIGMALCYYDYKDRFTISIEAIMFYFLMSPIIGFILGFPLMCCLPMDLYQKGNMYEIQGLSYKDSTIFIFKDRIKETTKYKMYVNENKNLKSFDIDSIDTKIIFDTGTPKLIVYELTPTDSWINNFAEDADNGRKSYLLKIPKF